MKKSTSVQFGYAYPLQKRVPMEGYEVESCVELPIKDGDADYDKAKYKRDWLATREEAVAWAKAHVEKDCWGAIVVTPYALTPFSDLPRIMHLDYTGDSEYIERD